MLSATPTTSDDGKGAGGTHGPAHLHRGFLLINAGAGLVVDSLAPLGEMIQGSTGAHGVIPTNEAIVGIAQEQFGARVAWLMITGFVLSLLLARFTPLRYVFLTGHHILFMATLITMVLATAGLTSLVVVRGAVEQLVHERHEALPEAADAVVPLAIPVRVRDEVGDHGHNVART